MGSVGLGAPFVFAALLMLAALVLLIATRRLLVDAEDGQEQHG
jgi:hypothetical protein